MSATGPIRRDPKYRPDHNRSITISGVIDDALVARLLPQIIKLQSESREPITLYIDSRGGNPALAKLLLDALRARDQDASKLCRLITVALGEASSAACDMTAGDYALAFPYSRILCHGTRYLIDEPTALILVADFLESHHADTVGGLLMLWGKDLIEARDVAEWETIAREPEEDQASWIIDRLGVRCLRIWFLFVFFCRQLQTGDFLMTATEAYWLGLIDEVIGLDLPSPRILVENAPDLPEESRAEKPA
jgi:ATP-dependent protease ClpP protease subunit